MADFTAATLLDAWERGLALSPLRRALLLASVDGSVTTGQLPVGDIARRLLSTRLRMFGETFQATASCPRCDERLEMTIDGRALLQDDGGDGADVLSLSADGFDVSFRLPTAADLLEVMDDDESAPRRLLARCILDARHEGEAIEAGGLPDEIIARIEEAMEAADEQSDVEIALTCPACGCGWGSRFDIGSFFWDEVDAWARRTLRDVHTMASAYGWREEDILSMSAWRRQAYLNLIGG